MNYLKVTGHDGLLRDTSSQAIINTNVSEYQNYINQRKAAEARLSEQDRQAEDINNIKSELSDIKQMLVMLLKDR
jgi:uncharacterized protein (UPF0276 family)